VDLLDAIEQHYELQHRQRQSEALSTTLTQPAAKLDHKEQMEDVAQAVKPEEVAVAQAANPYGFLTFR